MKKKKGKKNKNLIPGQKQYKNLKRTFIFGQLVTKKEQCQFHTVFRELRHDPFLLLLSFSENINDMVFFSLDCGTLFVIGNGQ